MISLYYIGISVTRLATTHRKEGQNWAGKCPIKEAIRDTKAQELTIAIVKITKK